MTESIDFLKKKKTSINPAQYFVVSRDWPTKLKKNSFFLFFHFNLFLYEWLKSTRQQMRLKRIDTRVSDAFATGKVPQRQPAINGDEGRGISYSSRQLHNSTFGTIYIYRAMYKYHERDR